MAEPVEWLPDGTPRSPRFGDIYRSSAGGLEQARHVFLRGCGLPGAWSGRARWAILETGFGLGLNFLATWQAWRTDPQRPRILHFVSVEAWPVSAADLRRSVAPYPELAALAEQLAAQWFGLLPGMHRLAFDDGKVLLTVFIGDVRDSMRQQSFHADSIFLDGFDPPLDPPMWELRVLKAMARRSRPGTRIATWTSVGEVRRDLTQCGFEMNRAEGLPPKQHCLQGVYSPAWEPKGQHPVNTVEPGHCAVIGAGLAGASVAASLARRGWRVTVLDAAKTPAAGASGLPVGLLAPNDSPDDNLLSRLSRCGVRITLQQARALLREGEDWCPTGVLECGFGDSPDALDATSEFASAWTRPAAEDQKTAAHLESGAAAKWHERAGWIKPAALVRAWLAHTGVEWRGSTHVARIDRCAQGWRMIDANGLALLEADLVVVAAAHASAELLGDKVALQPVRGQVSWAAQRADQSLPSFPINGNGHFIANVPTGQAAAWYGGSTFDRGDTDLQPRTSDHEANFERLRSLVPVIGKELACEFAAGRVNAWTGVRCVSQDRRPLLGELEPGLWVSTAMGSRGLTFAALCAELLAARLHGEPLPLEKRLADALGIARQLR